VQSVFIPRALKASSNTSDESANSPVQGILAGGITIESLKIAMDKYMCRIMNSKLFWCGAIWISSRAGIQAMTVILSESNDC
jgi:hypothetical protein